MFGSVIALIDDVAVFTKNIAASTKDVSVITQTAMKKTAGVLGDDLALNAEQVTGVSAKRELPVVWAVFKGSIINKIVLVPIAMFLYINFPTIFAILLMAGGAFLAFEGIHAVIEKIPTDKKKERQQVHVNAAQNPEIDLVAFEKDKINSAIRTDFILSAEIIAIALSTMQNYSLMTQIIGLSITVLVITIVVYGAVALLVRFDDIGLELMKKSNTLVKSFGRGLVNSVPYIMTTLSWLGMIALFMVGGGILLHGMPTIAHAVEEWSKTVLGTGLANSAFMLFAESLTAAIIGFAIFIFETLIKKYFIKQ